MWGAGGGGGERPRPFPGARPVLSQLYLLTWEIQSWWGWKGTSTWSHWLAGRACLRAQTLPVPPARPYHPLGEQGELCGACKGQRGQPVGGVDSEMGHCGGFYTPHPCPPSSYMGYGIADSAPACSQQRTQPSPQRRLGPSFLGITFSFDGFALEVTPGCLHLLSRVPALKR